MNCEILLAIAIVALGALITVRFILRSLEDEE